MNIQTFNEELLRTGSDNIHHFIRKFIFHGTPHVFGTRENEYFEFRSKIASHFRINFSEVFIVGSAKFGFSYIKGTDFNYDSDIDVVLVNENLFEYYYHQISDYQYFMDRLHRTVTVEEKQQYNSFLRYLVKGWMRPDLLPLSFQIEILKKEWFNFFGSISHGKSEVGNYKVTAGLYKNYSYLEKYYYNNIYGFYQKLAITGGQGNG